MVFVFDCTQNDTSYLLAQAGTHSLRMQSVAHKRRRRHCVDLSPSAGLA